MNLQRISFYILVFLLFGCQSREMEIIDPRPMQVLFLGHESEHHNARAYAPILQAALAPKGYYFTYTSDPDDLNEENLQDYDAIMLYANHDEITESQADALLAFVKGGGGFVPVHSASYCFRNSKPVVKLIGGQFASHDTATFQARIIEPDHPAMRGVQEFTSWDETYVHDKLTGDRTVLMVREDGSETEPYTWVKEYGRGRVFYTALGHDERTWSKPEFHGLLEQALNWAIGERKSEALAKLDLPTLGYSDAKIPNYEQRDPPPQLQAPLDPDASQKRIQIPPGFSLQLFAAEPDILKPISAAWDHRGRLWLLESRDYPNEINLEDGQGNDRIKILEDTDGDGRADKFTIFADHLSVPTSMVFANGGVVVSQAPHFLFLKDTDGDDVADEKSILFSGWGTFDTHAGPSNLQYGFDNKIWGVVGYSSFEGTVGEESHSFRQGTYRFEPDGSALEFMGATSNNTWGLGFTEAFDVLISTANNTHSAFFGIPERYFNGVEGLKIKSVKKIDGHYAFHPNTAHVRQVDVFGGFTAAAGHHLYTARNFPKEYWNRIALVCEPTGHLLHRAIIEPDGAGFVEKDGWNLLASSDEWVSPVHAEVGPDGAVWILDWYNFIIQHNPTPPGFENGPGNAHINPLRDKAHGRIYRLIYNGSGTNDYPEIGPEKLENCVDVLNNDNLFWRLHAQRLIVENKYLEAKDKLVSLVRNQEVDEIGLNTAAIHALWTLKGLELLGDADVFEAVKTALSHPSAAVRKNAVRILEPTPDYFSLIQNSKLWDDPDGGVRLAAILLVIDQEENEEIGTILYQLANDKSVLEDEWLARAVYVGAIKHKASFTRAMHARERDRIATGFIDEKLVVDYSGIDVPVEDWKNVITPSRWSESKAGELKDFDGIVWVKQGFTVPEALAGRMAQLSLGPIDDTDETYINGKRLGGMERKWNDDRNYRIPAGLLKAGENQITIKITDSRGRGGLYGEKKQLFIQIGNEKIDLSGIWKYKIEEEFKPDQEVFEDGMSITDLFLKYYGPYAKELSKDLPELPAEKFDRIVEMGTLKDQMKYDKEEFEVIAGEKVKIIFSNNDGMQHNLLIGIPGSLEMIGQAADKLAQSASGAENGYIPELTVIQAAAGLVDPGETREIIWQVPEKPGDYVYVCTFPGHWRTMNGVVRVRAKPAL
ncbi:MAG: ThuA domain-containing protein [Saprospiraceae bacterium]|nr:ThuA domain-containing protein [Saprospiraceae bacterium]